MSHFFNFSILTIFLIALGITSCKKKDIEPGSEGTGGCMDINSAFYSTTATVDDGSCEFRYVTEYELTNHEDVDWDLLINMDADVYLKIKRQSSTSWEFASNTINNADPNTIQIWSAPEQFQLMNEFYVWELWDEDVPPFDTDDAMATGTFNPLSSGNNGVVVSVSADGLTTIKIHYSQY